MANTHEGNEGFLCYGNQGKMSCCECRDRIVDSDADVIATPFDDSFLCYYCCCTRVGCRCSDCKINAECMSIANYACIFAKCYQEDHTKCCPCQAVCFNSNLCRCFDFQADPCVCEQLKSQMECCGCCYNQQGCNMACFNQCAADEFICCNSHSQQCCMNSDTAFPTTDGVPCAIGCCNIMCFGAEAAQASYQLILQSDGSYVDAKAAASGTAQSGMPMTKVNP